MKQINIGINGFGRIGRLLTRIIIKDSKKGVIKAINDIMPIESAAYLLKNDSIYGQLDLDIDIKENNLIINGNQIKYYQFKNINNIPWEDIDIEIFIESSGKIKTKQLEKIDNNIKKIVTHKDNSLDKTLIFGFNEKNYNPNKDKIISSGSCTAIATLPLIKIIKEKFGIKHCSFVTIHPLMGFNRTSDISDQDFRLGRNSIVSTIPSKSGLKNSITKFFPELKNKINCIKYYVPILGGTIINLSCIIKKNIKKEELIRELKKEINKNYFKTILYNCNKSFNTNKVSVDVLKTSYSVIINEEDIQYNSRNLNMILFLDNEWGYCKRLWDLINYIGKNEK